GFYPTCFWPLSAAHVVWCSLSSPTRVHARGHPPLRKAGKKRSDETAGRETSMTNIPSREEKIKRARQLGHPGGCGQAGTGGDHREAGRLVQGHPHQEPAGACAAANPGHEDEQPGAVLRPVPEVLEARPASLSPADRQGIRCLILSFEAARRLRR